MSYGIQVRSPDGSVEWLNPVSSTVTILGIYTASGGEAYYTIPPEHLNLGPLWVFSTLNYNLRGSGTAIIQNGNTIYSQNPRASLVIYGV